MIRIIMEKEQLSIRYLDYALNIATVWIEEIRGVEIIWNDEQNWLPSRQIVHVKSM